jgi:hypothetical protein
MNIDEKKQSGTPIAHSGKARFSKANPKGPTASKAVAGSPIVRTGRMAHKDVVGTGSNRWGGPAKKFTTGSGKVGQTKGTEPGHDLDGGSVSAFDTKRSQLKLGSGSKTGTRTTGPTTSSRKTGTISRGKK